MANQDTVKLDIIDFHNAELPNVRVRFASYGALAFTMETLGTLDDYRALATHIRSLGHAVDVQRGGCVDGAIWRCEALVTMGGRH